MSTSNRFAPVSPRPLPLKVLLVMDTRRWAGTESYVQTLALALREAGNDSQNHGLEVSIAAPPDSMLWKRARQAGLPVVAIARRHPWSLDTLQTLTRSLRRGSTDVIHAHNGRTALFGALAVRLARRGACVLTHHFIAPAHANSRGALGHLKGAVHSRLAAAIAQHIAISSAVAGGLRERGEVAPERITIVRNGIETPRPDAAQDQALPDELRAEIACVARLQKEKDLPTLVRALKILRDQRAGEKRQNGTRPPRCVIAGEGDERESLETLIREENLGDGVHLAGFTPLTGALMRAAQVFVLPSVAEPFGLALVEAMAQKRAVVAIDAGGPPEIVVQGETGILVPPGDARAMAQALDELLRDPARARAMGEAGFERFQTHFTSARMARETLEVYRRALKSN